ncbi:MAG: TonB-dependent receptor plug domain-containing protein, partial [Nitrosomonadales bacterium]|nr:TonB-dependent receptor plug domain-containing protein [Nitrosomonadales bacterium]
MTDIVVTATRTESEINNIPATVSVIDSPKLKRNLPYDEADLFKDEPDIAMSRDLRRFGSTRVNIRGIEDNRVTQLVDGVRISDYYNGGGPTNFTMSTPLGVSIGFLRQIEILRGPASSLYGSDAIGGVVGYLTLNPSDLIENGEGQGARYRLSYNGINSSWSNTLLGAFQGESAEFLLGYTHTEGHSADNKGGIDGTTMFRSKPNPQDFTDAGALAKLILHPSEKNRITITLEGRDQKTDTNIKRLSASPTMQKISQMTGEDKARRERGSIEWQYTPQYSFFDRVTARLFQQN